MLNVFTVGIAGAAGAGKSTIARAILPIFDRAILPGRNSAWAGEAVIAPFAGPLKRGFELMGVTKEETPHQYREYLQLVGAGMRAFDPGWWVKRWLGDLPNLDADVVIADDCRYPNECEACDLVFFIEPDFVSNRKLKPEHLTHESEDMARAGFNSDYHDAKIVNPLGKSENAAAAIATHILLVMAERHAEQMSK